MPSDFYFIVQFLDINVHGKSWVKRVIVIAKDALEAINLCEEKTNYPLREKFQMQKVEFLDITPGIGGAIIRKDTPNIYSK